MNLEIIQFIVLILMINSVVAILRVMNNSKSLVLYCGIIGYSSKKPVNIDKLALLMLHNSLKRGEDNTGIYSLETGVIKSGDKAEKFLQEHTLPKTNLFIGHVRKASVGSKLEKNAHPVEYNNIVLAHNGTLNNHWSMCTSAGYKSSDFDTDTQVLAKLLDDDMKKEKIVFSTLSEYQGYAALLFTDKRDPEVLYAYRNDDRPLFNGNIDGSMYISSMEENLKIIGCKDIKEFPPFYVHTIKFGKLLTSMYYKPKEKTTTNHYSYVNNVNYKNEYSNDAALDFLKAVNSTVTKGIVHAEERWVRSIYTRSLDYDGQKISLTKGKFYYVEDISESNPYDIQVIDDNNNMVWINIYMVSLEHIDYPNNYCVADVNIFNTEKPTLLMFTKGTIIPIVERAIVNDIDNTLACIYEDGIATIDVSCIRPATDEEVEKHVEAEAKKVNDNLKLLETSTTKKSESGLIILSPGKQETLFDKLAKQASNAKDSVVFPPPDDQIEIIDETSETETEEIVTHILNQLDDVADDIEELARVSNWDEFKAKSKELKNAINEAYNIEIVKESMQKD